MVAISVHALCEFAWVLDRSYGTRRADISAAIRLVLDMRNVVVDRPAIQAGLSLDAGGDFADGVIAFDGLWRGAETFVSFDKRAVRFLEAQGNVAVLLS